MRVALIKGGRCINVIICNSQEADLLQAEGVCEYWVVNDALSVGDEFDGTNITRTRQTQPVIRRKAFIRRFTAQEREALEGIKATGTQAQKNKLNAFLNYLLMDDEVDLTDPYIIATVQLMETAGIINTGRAAEILAS